jgi:HPt (histidine-containing phosphotransfer) domain-containing protein
MSHIPEQMMEKPREAVETEGMKELPKEMEWLNETEGISVEEGIRNSGGVETYIFSLNLFLDTIESNSKVIRDSYDIGDIKLYTIKVHALKSSARIIGAERLSELAASLEEAGNKGNMEFIKENAGKLMSEYESYKERLARLRGSGEQNLKEPIAEDELKEAFETLSEVISQMDYDSTEMILKELGEYTLPPEDGRKVRELSVMLKSFNWEGLRRMVIFDLKTFKVEKIVDISDYFDEPEGIDFWEGTLPDGTKGMHLLITYRRNTFKLTWP